MDLQRLIDVFFNLSVAAEYLPALLKGAWITVSLAFVVVVCGLAAGLALALIRLASPRWIVEILRLWVDCMRALPPLALLLLMYFGLPSLGVNLSATWVLGLVLTAILAAFAEEIFWAGITAIPKGQTEASRSTGMTQSQTLRYVILPQAMKICLPPLTNRTIGITKNTALGTAIGMPELLNEAQTAQAFSGNATPLIMAAVGYMIIFIPLTTLAGRIEKPHGLGAQGMNTLIDQFFNIDIMMQAFPFLLKGLLITVLLTALLAPLGIATGLGLALASGARNGFVRAAVRTWVNTFRALPPLVLIIVIYSALPFLGIRLPAFPCVIVALALNNSAYYCEILRAGIGAVPKGQMEAARSTGLTQAGALRHVVLPQAFRIVLPDLASNTIEVVKGTSLASIIAVGELLYMAGVARSVTFNTSPITLAALLYLVILLPAVRLSGRLARPAA